MFLDSHNANKSFNLIGNYGTGKSTFLWALEKNLNREEEFFTNISITDRVVDFEFLKIIGTNSSLVKVLSEELALKGELGPNSIVNALSVRREAAKKKGKGLIL